MNQTIYEKAVIIVKAGKYTFNAHDHLIQRYLECIITQFNIALKIINKIVKSKLKIIQ